MECGFEGVASVLLYLYVSAYVSVFVYSFILVCMPEISLEEPRLFFVGNCKFMEDNDAVSSNAEKCDAASSDAEK